MIFYLRIQKLLNIGNNTATIQIILLLAVTPYQACRLYSAYSSTLPRLLHPQPKPQYGNGVTVAETRRRIRSRNAVSSTFFRHPRVHHRLYFVFYNHQPSRCLYNPSYKAPGDAFSP